MIQIKCDKCDKTFEGHTIKEVENQKIIHTITQHKEKAI